MKKVLYFIGSVLEVALIAGAYVFNYFTNKKIGMSRFVGFMNQNWQKNYPLETLKLAAVAVVLLSAILLLLFFIKNREEMNLEIRLSVVAMAALSFGYIGFTLLLSVEKIRAYYFVSLMLGIAALLQIIKTFARLMGK